MEIRVVYVNGQPVLYFQEYSEAEDWFREVAFILLKRNIIKTVGAQYILSCIAHSKTVGEIHGRLNRNGKWVDGFVAANFLIYIVYNLSFISEEALIPWQELIDFANFVEKIFAERGISMLPPWSF